jgi:hypothetical protein
MTGDIYVLIKLVSKSIRLPVAQVLYLSPHNADAEAPRSFKVDVFRKTLAAETVALGNNVREARGDRDRPLRFRCDSQLQLIGRLLDRIELGLRVGPIHGSA